MSPTREFKVAFIGDGGVGKAELIKCLRRDNKDERNYRFMMVKAPVNFRTNVGSVQFDIWDTVGREKYYKGLQHEQLAGAHGAIIMFDAASLKKVPNWIRDLTSVCGNELPIVLIGTCNMIATKIDGVIGGGSRLPDSLADIFKKKYSNLSYHEVGRFDHVDEGIQRDVIEAPLLCLARQLLGDDSLYFYQPSTWHSELVQAVTDRNHALSKPESHVLSILGDTTKLTEENGTTGTRHERAPEDVETLQKRNFVFNQLVKIQKAREDAEKSTDPFDLLCKVAAMLPDDHGHTPLSDDQKLVRAQSLMRGFTRN